MIFLLGWSESRKSFASGNEDYLKKTWETQNVKDLWGCSSFPPSNDVDLSAVVNISFNIFWHTSNISMLCITTW